MFIVPLTGKFSWRNPPVITIGIILVNCLAFFLLQGNEGKMYHEAEKYYFESSLNEMEAPLYLEYLDSTAGDTASFEQYEKMDEEDRFLLHQRMEMDSPFIKKLHNDEIFSREDPEYLQWKDLRKRYEEKLFRIVSLNYGFRPAYKTPVTFFSYMFLHGDFFHLLGNMVFLWLVGCMLELGYGRVFYFVVYTFGGLASVGLFWSMNMDSIVPLIGASGAVSALIGAYTTLRGRKKIKIFFSLGVYFNHLKVPGFALLPIWIGNELFQLLFQGDSHIAYVAHIGGLMGGALLGYVNMKCSGFCNEAAFQEEPIDRTSHLMEEALQRIRELDLKGGCQLLEEMLSKDPNNYTALIHLFNTYKNSPDEDQFHETAKRLLLHLSQNKHTYEMAHTIYKEYLDLARKPSLSPELCVRLSSVFSVSGYLEKSEKILAMLLQKRPNFPGLSTALFKLANAYREKGMLDAWRKCQKIIYSQFPDSAEGKIARGSLGER